MTAPRLTNEAIDGLIADHDFIVTDVAPTLTVCVIKLITGGVVIGRSIPVSEENFDGEMGREFAYRDAREKIWELEGYAMKRDRTLAAA